MKSTNELSSKSCFSSPWIYALQDKTKKKGGHRVKSWPNVASKQLQSTTKYIDIACKTNFFLPYLRQAAKIYVSTSYSVVRQETIEISEQRTAFVWFFAQEVDWCMINCDKQRLQTSVSINLWKILAGHTGDWFDVKTASICTTELWDALESFILTSLKFKVAPYPIIVSLDTLKPVLCKRKSFVAISHWSNTHTAHIHTSILSGPSPMFTQAHHPRTFAQLPLSIILSSRSVVYNRCSWFVLLSPAHIWRKGKEN